MNQCTVLRCQGGAEELVAATGGVRREEVLVCQMHHELIGRGARWMIYYDVSELGGATVVCMDTDLPPRLVGGRSDFGISGDDPSEVLLSLTLASSDGQEREVELTVPNNGELLRLILDSSR